MFLFVEDKLLNAANKLEAIKDIVLQEDLPLFLLGQKEDVQKAQTYLPPHTVQESFVRPIDIKEVAIRVRMTVDRFSGEERRNILVVDDSGAYLRSVREWLGDRYQVTLANSGTMAIKSMTLKKPDLILLDYEMPVVDGKQVLEMIRWEPEFSEIPVIFLTGKNDKQSIMDVMGLKPSGYLLKTMEPIEIIRAVDDFFAKHRF
ncbi:MAG: response regulator [Lachnospiraceae bacterium]|nr:response regulator [Lachnospiraceae bacterium]